MVAGINIPVKVGEAIVMPGDVVLGNDEGVIFIPPHLVKEIVEQADLTHIHDDWTKEKVPAPASTRPASCTAGRR